MNAQDFATVGNLINTIDCHGNWLDSLKSEFLNYTNYTEIPQLVTERWYCLALARDSS